MPACKCGTSAIIYSLAFNSPDVSCRVDQRDTKDRYTAVVFLRDGSGYASYDFNLKWRLFVTRTKFDFIPERIGVSIVVLHALHSVKRTKIAPCIGKLVSGGGDVNEAPLCYCLYAM